MTQHTQPVVVAQHQQQQQQPPPPQQHQQQQAQQTTNTSSINNNHNSNTTSASSNSSSINNQTQTLAVQQHNNNSYQQQQLQQQQNVAAYNSQLHSSNIFIPTHGMPPSHPHHPHSHHPHHQPGATMYPTMIPAQIPSNVYVNNVTANVNLHGWAHTVPHGAWVHPSGTPQYIHTDMPSEQGVPVIQQMGPMPVTLPPGNALTAPLMNPNPAGGSRGSRRGRGRGGSSGSRRNDYNLQRHPQPEGSPVPQQSSQSNQQDMQQQQQQQQQHHNQQGLQSSDAQQMMATIPPTYVQHPQYATHAPQYQYGYPTYFAPQQHMIHPGQSAAAQQATGAPLYISTMPVYNGPPMYNYGYFIPPVMNPNEYQYVSGEDVGPDGDERQSSIDGSGPMMWHQQQMYAEEYSMNPGDMHSISADEMNHNPSSMGSADDTPGMLSPNYAPIYDPQLHEQMQQHMGVMQLYDDPQIGQMQVMHPQPGLPQMEDDISECGSQPSATIQIVSPGAIINTAMSVPPTNEQMIHQHPPHLIPVVTGGTILPIGTTITPTTTSQHQQQQQQQLSGESLIESVIQTYEQVTSIMQPGESVTSLIEQENLEQYTDNLAAVLDYQQVQQHQPQLQLQNICVETMVQTDNYSANINNKILMTDVQELQENVPNVMSTNVEVAIETPTICIVANNQPQQLQQPIYEEKQQQYALPQQIISQSVPQQPLQHQQLQPPIIIQEQQAQPIVPQQQQQSQQQSQQNQSSPQQQPSSHYQAAANPNQQQPNQQQQHSSTYESRKSTQIYSNQQQQQHQQQQQQTRRKYDSYHSHGSNSSSSNNNNECNSSNQQQQQPPPQTAKTMSWTNSSQHKKSTNTVAVTATPISSHAGSGSGGGGTYNRQSSSSTNSGGSSSSHGHPTRTYTNQQHHSYQQQQQQQNYHYQQQPQTRNYGSMKTPSSPISIAPTSTTERKTSQSSDAGSKTQAHHQQTSTTSTASTTAAPHQFHTQQPSKNDNLPIASETKTISAKQYPSGFANKKQSNAVTPTANTAEASTSPAINLAPPASTTTPVAPSTPSWASLFAGNVNASSALMGGITATAAATPTTHNVLNSSTSTSTNYSKKPIAKVAPYEGITPVTPTAPLVTPGNMSYSAASAQNLPTPPQTGMTLSTVNKRHPSDQQLQSQRNSLANLDEFSLKFADFLTKYKSDWATISLRPRGLTNRSNYCYINSILQALLGCSPLYNLIRSIPKQAANLCEVKTPTINAMITFMSNFSNLPSGLRLRNTKPGKGANKDDLGGDLQCDPAFEPTEIYKLWNDSREEHVEGRQEDAEEFLSYMLNKLNDEMLEVIKLIAKPSPELNGPSEQPEEEGDVWQMICNNRNKGSVTRQTDFGCTPLSEIFRGELRSRLQREGEHSTDVIQPFFTLQLNIEKAASVKEALEILVGRDQLEGVTGSKTKQEVVAWQQMNLEKLPPILILHLKWFDYRSDGCTKIIKKVEFPVELKVDAKILASKKYSQKQRAYRLFAVVYHDGKEATKGHYITDVYHTGYGSWLRYDDSSVKPVSENHVLLPRTPRVPYLLCYRRCDTITQPHASSSHNVQGNSSTGNNNSSGNTPSSGK